MFPRHIHHKSISNNAMKRSRMSEKWAKKARFESAKSSTQLFKNTQKLLYTPQWHFMSLNMGPLSSGDSILEWLLPEAKREKFNWKQRPVSLSAACEPFNSGNEINRKLKKSPVFTFKRTQFQDISHPNSNSLHKVNSRLYFDEILHNHCVIFVCGYVYDMCLWIKYV